MTARACRERSRKLVEMDEHVSGCEVCREEAHLLCAMRGSLKRTVRASAPEGMRERIAGAMVAESAREEAARGAVGRAGVWQSVVPLATAAAVAVAWGLAAKSDARPPANEASLVGSDELLSELVNEHRWPMPPETTDPKAVRGFERYVGVPVRASNFERVGAHLVGGRVLPTPHAQRAAMLQYEVGSGDNMRRVSVLVYDAQKIQVGTANLAPREIGTTEVRVGRENGFSVAATERAGVGYLLASDLDPDKSAQLAAMLDDGAR